MYRFCLSELLLCLVTCWQFVRWIILVAQHPAPALVASTVVVEVMQIDAVAGLVRRRYERVRTDSLPGERSILH